MSEIDFVYNFDKRGVNPLNLVVGEKHTIDVTTAKVFLAEHGLFYTKSVVLKLSTSTAPLTKGLDYRFDGFDEVVTAYTGLETASAIEIVNPDILGEVELTCQMVGGREGYHSTMYNDLLKRLANLNTGVIPYSHISNKPAHWPPSPHLHQVITDLTGLEQWASKLNELIVALVYSRTPVDSGRELSDRLDRILALYRDLREDLTKLLNTDATLYPATLEEALVGIIKDKYINPYVFKRGIESLNIPASASLSETTDGVITNKYIPPSVIKEIIPSKIPLEQARLGLEDGKFTTAYVVVNLINEAISGLSSGGSSVVAATLAEGLAGVVNNKYVAPDVLAAILAQITPSQLTLSTLAQAKITSELDTKYINGYIVRTLIDEAISGLNNLVTASLDDLKNGVDANKLFNPSVLKAYIDYRLLGISTGGTILPATLPDAIAGTDTAKFINSEVLNGFYNSKTPSSGGNSVIAFTKQVIVEDISLPDGYNGISAGPVVVQDGVTVTVPPGATWHIA